jgi:gamma-glutamyl-gamma-aminobutyrate hydrolase PuuD
MQFLSQFGYVRLISTSDNLETIVDQVDMLVVPGGADVDATRYRAVPGVMDGRTNQHYEYLDSVLMPIFVENRKPIVGICRGMQSLNVFFGGTLHQHIVGHQQGEDRAATRQPLQFVGSDQQIFVNSMHHQSVDVLGVNLELVGYTRAYQGCYSGLRQAQNWRNFNKNTLALESRERVPVIIEVIKHVELPIIGFQYHPEEFNCEYAVKEIKKLLEI